MKRIRKAVAAVLGTGVLLAIGILAAPAATATVYPTCDGSSCLGLDPTRTYSSIDGYRCDAGAYTPWTQQQGLAAVSTAEGYVELRYGPHCHANWARISSSSPGTWFWVQNWNKYNQQYYVPSGYTSGYTNMVNGYPLARAGDAGGHTGWY